MPGTAEEAGWLTLLRREWTPPLAVLLGGVLLHSMNVLLVATVLPSIVEEVGGAALMSWPTTAFLASSIVAATCTGLLTAIIGAGRTFCAGALIFAAGTLLCAFAPAMSQIIGGRFVQGFGGGLLSAVAYVLVRSTFPEAVWPRVFALLAGVWSVSVLVGPLVGGVFVRYRNWRGAFFAVAAIAGLLAVMALRALGAETPRDRRAAPRVPGGRVALVCLAIIAMSLAAVVSAPLTKASLVVVAIAALALVLKLDRAADVPLLPSDAFSLRSATGIGLWIALLVSIAFVPLQIFVPVFLQTLHGFDALSAGYAVAAASMAWTVSALAVAGLSSRWSERSIIAGPLIMGMGLLGMAVAMPAGPVAALVPAIALIGVGIGACWAFLAQRIMRGAKAGEEVIAASSVATVQQTGLALGAAVAGLVANAVGFSALDARGTVRAAYWVPATFVSVAAVAGLMGVRLRSVGREAASPGVRPGPPDVRRRPPCIPSLP